MLSMGSMEKRKWQRRKLKQKLENAVPANAAIKKGIRIK